MDTSVFCEKQFIFTLYVYKMVHAYNIVYIVEHPPNLYVCMTFAEKYIN